MASELDIVVCSVFSVRFLRDHPVPANEIRCMVDTYISGARHWINLILPVLVLQSLTLSYIRNVSLFI
jgi:hypothetical protein